MASTAVLETLAVATSTETVPPGGELYEIVDGRRIEPPMSFFAGLVGTELGGYLIAHIRERAPRPGQLAIEVLFWIPLSKDSNRKRRPDIAFVSSERWPLERPKSL